ncbi:MAG: Brp/Blh family beta-carotene 15,15'-dioxygenase [Chitinophagales bacterium]|nr:Brp/Blh family beta-carotene 15,15'-dioxygenase [Hyphomicrobiales bacterium]
MKQPSATGDDWEQAALMHRIGVCALFAMALAATILGFGVAAEDNIILSVAMTLLLGMPHGAMDVALATSYRDQNTLRCRAVFIGRYLGLAGMVMLMWRLYPGISLCLFLVISAAHFADDWKADFSLPQRLILGIALLSFPAILYEQNLSDLFAWLVPAADAVWIAHTQGWVALVIAPVAAGIIAVNIHKNHLAGAEAALVLALSIAATPLTFFLLYFCCLHSVRHLMDASRTLRLTSLKSAAVTGFPYALAAFLGVVGFALFGLNGSVDSNLFMSLFVGLAALTVPHMLLSRH